MSLQQLELDALCQREEMMPRPPSPCEARLLWTKRQRAFASPRGCAAEDVFEQQEEEAAGYAPEEDFFFGGLAQTMLDRLAVGDKQLPAGAPESMGGDLCRLRRARAYQGSTQAQALAEELLRSQQGCGSRRA
eukprot:TRINITY_DN7286_c0_g1_i2.p3 TRINITY_DN7286_c0_g1~~TRINITY_DN7286_c0_g1_i2.p3  ORF type:complete len:133 (+),score=39.72 TRINITY_DN7286_c0_g1_i2:86-484(+)